MFKKYIIVLSLILFSGCGLLKDKKVDKKKESIRFIDRSVITEKAPGDIIVLTAPKIPQDRPKGKTVVTKGEKGSTVTTKYDDEGFLETQVINCPDVEVTKQMDIKGKYQLQTKEVEMKMNIELANVIGRWMCITCISIALIFAIAGWLRSKTKIL